MLAVPEWTPLKAGGHNVQNMYVDKIIFTVLVLAPVYVFNLFSAIIQFAVCIMSFSVSLITNKYFLHTVGSSNPK